MIPIKLKMQAFLPFNEEQVIDFNVIENDKIFLITGNTGAGKTAVFDAIFFALYGCASGSEREKDSFKSLFADDATLSYVEFTFKNKGKIYTVYRTPAQLRLRRNGHLTGENATATITLESGEIISGVNSVNAYIESIIGLNAEQFKKIVMLPQGEFRRFLSDNSSEKQEILRKIFSTDIFEEFTLKLKEKNSELSLKSQKAEASRENFCSSIIPLPDSSLAEALTAENKNYEKIVSLCEEYNAYLDELIAKQNSKINSLTERKFYLDIEKFKETNKKLDGFKKVKSEYALLLDKKDEFSAKRKELALLEKAKEIKAIFDSLKDTEKQIDIKNKDLPILKKNYELSNAEYEKSFESFNTIADISEEISRLKAISEIFESLKAQNLKLKKLNEQISEAQEYFDAFKIKAENQKINNILSLISKLDNTFEESNELNQAFKEDSFKYQNAFNIFIKNQAHNLAVTLKENEPCPVCGSTHHPSPALKNDDKHIDENELKRLKEAYETSANRLRESNEKLNEIKFTLKEYVSDDIIQKDIPKLTESFSAKLKEENNALAKNELYSSLDDEGFASLLTKLNANKESINEQALSLEKEILQFNITEEQLNNKLKEKSALIEKIKAEFKAAQEKKDKDKAEFERNNEALKQLLSSKEELKVKFKNMLSESKIDDNALPSLFDKLDSFEELKKEISEYEISFIRYEEQLKAYTKELKDASYTDIEKAEKELEDVKEKLNGLTDEYEKNLSVVNTNRAMCEKLNNLNEQFKEISYNYNQVNQLYQIASGKNKSKVSFERYVLGVYFDSVIQNANLRLVKITGGRYYLRRRADKERGNSPSGLELEIFDSFNGKFRHVNTLSGGESFKTALCLALGLADTVTQNSGGIEINTIFIDEGFGTLDSDALDSAVECLYSIKASGRYIGVISHVNELCEKIPLKLYVSEGKNGSKVSFKESN